MATALHALLSDDPLTLNCTRSNALARTQRGQHSTVEEDDAQEEHEDDAATQHVSDAHEADDENEQQVYHVEGEHSEEEHPDADSDVSPASALVDPVLEAAVEAELQVSAAIEMHLNEIQRLRASNVIRHARASMIQRQSPKMVALQRQGSMSSPKLANQHRVARTIRSFSHSMKHPMAVQQQLALAAAVIEEQSVATMSADALRRKINGAVSGVPSSRGSSARSSAQQSSADSATASNATSQEVSPTQHARRSRAKHTKGSHNVVSEPNSTSRFAVIVSPVQSPRSTVAKKRHHAKHSSTLSLNIPAPTESDDELIQLSDHQHEEGDDDAAHDHAAASTAQESPRLKRFRHNHTPSMSERLNTSKMLLRSPAHRVAASLIPDKKRSSSVSVAAKQQQRSQRGKHKGREPESESEPEEAEGEQEEQAAESGSENEEVHDEPERVTRSIFDTVMDHTPSSEEDENQPAEEDEVVSPAQLAHALNLASSTVNITQSTAAPHSPGRSPARSRGVSPAPMQEAASKIARRNTPPLSTSRVSSGTSLHQRKRSNLELLSPTSGAVAELGGSAALPPRSPQQPSLLTVPGAAIPLLSLQDLSGVAGAVTEAASAEVQPRTSADLPAAQKQDICAASATVTTDGTGFSAEELCTATTTPAKPTIKRTLSLPLDGDLLVTSADRDAAAPTWRLSHTPSMLKRSLTIAGVGAGAKKDAATALLTPSTAGSPPQASISPTLLSPGSSGLTSAAWLERRMQKMFRADDATKTAGDTTGGGGATAGGKTMEDASAATTMFALLSAFLGLADPTRLTWSSFAMWLPSFFQVCLPFIILFQAIVIPMRLAFGITLFHHQDAAAAAAPGAATTPASALLEGENEFKLFFDYIHMLEIPTEATFALGVLCTDYIDLATLSIRAGFKRAGPHRMGLWVQLACDLLSVFPFELLQYVLPLEQYVSSYTTAMPTLLTAILRLPRVLRLARLFQYLDVLEARNLVETYINPTAFRLCKLAVVMYLVAHQAGCGYVFLSYVELVNLPEGNEWMVPVHIRTQPLVPQYLHCIHWGFSSMTGNGSGVQAPQTAVEHVYALVVLLIGVSTYATLIGNLSSIIQSMNSKQESFREKMTSITSLMDTYKLPADVQHRVKSCFQYLFNVTPTSSSSSSSAEEDSLGAPRARGEGWDVLQYLPAYLRNEVLCHLNGEIIHKVPLFRGCSDGFMRSLVPLLRPEVVIPGDYIIRTGEIGREMVSRNGDTCAQAVASQLFLTFLFASLSQYLLRHGQLEVIAHGVVVATLSDGSYVGEVAVMFEQKRTASVRALTFCDILVLSKDDFDGVLSQYPEVQRSMKMQATMRRNARSLQDKEFKATEAEKANQANQAKKRSETSEGQPPPHAVSGGKTPRPSVAGRPRSPNSATRILITGPPSSSTPRPRGASIMHAAGGSGSAKSPAGAAGREPHSARETRGSRITTPRKSIAQHQQHLGASGASPSVASTPAKSRSLCPEGGPGSPATSTPSLAGVPPSLAALSHDSNAIEYDPRSGLPCGMPPPMPTAQANGTLGTSGSDAAGTTMTEDRVAHAAPVQPSKWKKLRLLTRGQ
jgi:hypothetical protein